MGLAANLLSGLIEEASYRPFSGTSCTFGRQSMGMSPETVLKVMEAKGVKPAEGVTIETDAQTTAAVRGRSGMILDYSFFSLLGFEKTLSADISDFEGADIIVDLNKPISDEYAGVCDFLADGSLLDNIFDPVTGLKNIARMVRPGGRVMIIDLGNSPAKFPGIPYTMLTGAWFYDFFTANEWSDLQVYACCYHEGGAASYMIDHDHMTRRVRRGLLKPMESEVPMAIVTFAEKGENSTWDRVPTQHAYRPDAEWETFEATVERYRQSKRPPLLRSAAKEPRDKFTPGWNFIAADGTVHKPQKPQPAPPEEVKAPVKTPALKRLRGLIGA